MSAWTDVPFSLLHYLVWLDTGELFLTVSGSDTRKNKCARFSLVIKKKKKKIKRGSHSVSLFVSQKE